MTMKDFKTQIEFILDNLHDKEGFIKSCLEAAHEALEKGEPSIFYECLEEWKATAEINAIPGMRKRVAQAYEEIKAQKTTLSWEDFKKSLVDIVRENVAR